MVKHTPTICRLLAEELSVFDHFGGLTLKGVNLIQNYLTNRKQRTKINDSYNSWSHILFGVPQDFILGPLLFNTFLHDLFLIVKDINIAMMIKHFMIHVTL